ncbi:MAG: murein biosynthesis integral membrane protein MurJ [Phycisphaerae bacterium]|jgi:putative peptidoglycan lipid II flippase
MDDKAHREREHFFTGAKIVAVITLLSRVLGMLRDMAIVWLGAKWQNDAFQFAFAIPNLFRRLFGEGALSAAFVPVFTEASEEGGTPRASRLLANAMGLMSVFLLALMVLIMAGMTLWSACSPNRPDRQFLVLLSNIMLPFMVTMCLLAIGSAALNCRGHFAYPAAAPILLNLCVIAAAWLIAPWMHENRGGQLTVVAIAVSISGVLQLAGVLWLLKRSGFPLRPTLWPVQDDVRRMLKLMAPMLLGIGFLQISSLFDYVIAWLFTVRQYSSTVTLFGHVFHRPLSEGVLVRLAAAQRLYQFPMGVLAISLGIAVFPLLARYASRGDMSNLRDSFNRAMRLAMMEGLATGAGLFLLAKPIIGLIYRHGDFMRADADQSAFILQMYVLGLWAYCTYQIVLRAFYSLKDPTTPLKVSCVMAVVYMASVSVLIWVPRIGAGAFGLTAAGTFSLNVVLMTVLLRKRIGRIGGRKLLASTLRSLACCAVMAAVVLALRYVLAGRSNGLVVAACVPAGAAAFLATAWAMKAPELGELLGAVRRPPAADTGPTGGSL